MRPEVQMWHEQASKDLDSAKKNLSIGEYHITAFLCQQASEKILKALYLHKFKKSAGNTHSLHILGQELSAPANVLSAIRFLMPDFVFTRYPDVAGDVPYKLYDESLAKKKLRACEDVFSWAEKQF